MRCPKCNIELSKLRHLKEDGTYITLYSHPSPLTKCEYSQDGFNIEVVDERLMNVFQELIKSEGKEEKVCDDIVVERIPKDDNFQVIKNRLAQGDLTILEYDEVLKRM